MGILKKCIQCTGRNLIILGEAGHTRVYYCTKCKETHEEWVKKEIKCKHRFGDDDICQLCNYERNHNKYV